MLTSFMQTRSLIEAKIIEVRDVISGRSRINIIIPLSSYMIILHPACTRSMKNRKRRTLDYILRTARKGCIIVTRQTNFDILEHYLYIVCLTKDDLDRMMVGIWGKEKDKLINEIYNETFNT